MTAARGLFVSLSVLVGSVSLAAIVLDSMYRTDRPWMLLLALAVAWGWACSRPRGRG